MNKKNILLLSVIIVITGAIRIFGALNWHGFIFDEIVSISIAEQPLNSLWTYLRWEMNPPLHYLYLSGWIALFGNSEAVLRLSSVPIGISAIIVMYLLGTTLFKSRTVGLYTALITSLASSMLFYSIVVRMYNLLFVLTALSTYFFYKTFFLSSPSYNKRQRTYIFWYALTLLLALYTHLTSLALPIIHGLFLLYILHKEKRGFHISCHPELVEGCTQTNVPSLRQAQTDESLERERYKTRFKRGVFVTWVITTSIAGLLFLPWFINLLANRLNSLGTNSWYIYAQPFEIFFFTLPVRFLVGNVQSQFVAIAVFIFFLGVVLTGLYRITKQSNDEWKLTNHINSGHILALLLMFVPMIILFALQLNSQRYYTIPMVGVFLLIGAGLARLPNTPIPRKILVTLAIVLLAIPSIRIMYMEPVAWPQIAQFIEKYEQPGDRVITAFWNELLAVRYYYNGNVALETFIPKEFEDKKFNTELEFVVHGNIHINVNKDNIHEFADLVSNSKRVFFVFDSKLFGTAHEHYIHWFLDNGWKRLAYAGAPDSSGIQVWLLTKIK